MDRPFTESAGAAPQLRPASIGRVAQVGGAHAVVELEGRAPTHEHATVGKFMGLMTGKTIIIALVTEVAEKPVSVTGGAPIFRKMARVDLIGEIKVEPKPARRASSAASPNIPISATAPCCSTERDLRLVYGSADTDHAHIGDLQQNPNIGVHIDIDQLVSRHFALLGATGVGKSSGVVIILQQILAARPNLRIFLVDPHNEYSHCFGDKAQVLNPRNLRLPFWLFNFEETVDVFFGGRPGVDEEIEISGGSHSGGEVGLSAIPQPAPNAHWPSAAIRATPASPPTRRCLTASRTCSRCSTSAWAGWRTVPRASSIPS